MEMGRSSALVRAVSWGRLNYALIGHMVRDGTAWRETSVNKSAQDASSKSAIN